MAKSAVAVKPKSTAVSVDVATQIKRDIEELATRVTAPTGAKIDVEDKVFTLPTGAKSDTSIDVVVVEFAYRNTFYAAKYQKGTFTTPICYAAALQEKGMAPVAESSQKQSEACGTCEQNAFGSDGAGKACKNSVVMAVLPIDATAETPIWTIAVSPTALKRFSGYVTNLAATHKTAPYAVVTRLSFEASLKYPSLVFAYVEAAPTSLVQLALARREEARKMLLAPPDLTEKAAPAAKGKAPVLGSRRK